jgi:hypothetical protein
LGSGEIPRDGETKASASALPGPSFLGSVETIEDVRQMIGGYTRSAILDVCLDPTVERVTLYSDNAA